MCTATSWPAGRVIRPAGRPARSLAALGCAALVAVAVMLLTPLAAAAHAVVVSSDPASGADLAKAPKRISVTFDESVQIQHDSLRVIDSRGRRVDTGATTQAPGKPAVVRRTLKPGLHGTLTVQWHVISADSHPVWGAFPFSVGAPTSTSAGHSATARHGDEAVAVTLGVDRWLGYAAFALLAGGCCFVLYCWPGALRRGTRARRGIRALLLGGLAALLVATVGELALQGPYGAGRGLGGIADPSLLRATVSGRLGTLLCVRLPLLAAAAAFVVWLLERLPAAGRAGLTALRCCGVALGVAIALTWSLAGHAATQGQAALAVPLDVAHLSAMAAWLGGLTLLAGIVLRPGSDAAPVAGRDAAAGADVRVPAGAVHQPRARGWFTPASRAPGGTTSATASDRANDGASDSAAPAAPDGVLAATQRFSGLALCCVCVLVASGLFQAWRQVGTFGALPSTEYGKLLLVKVAIVVVLVGLGYLARRRLGAGSGTDLAALRRGVRIEALLGVGVLAVTAALVASPPAKVSHVVPVDRTAHYDTGGPGGTGQVGAHVAPARIGPDSIRLHVTGPGGASRSPAEVQAAFSLPDRHLGPLPVKLRRTGTGRYVSAAPVVLAADGDWRLTVTIRTDAIDETTVSLPVPIAGS